MLISCALHALALLALLAGTRGITPELTVATWTQPSAGRAVEVAMVAPSPRIAPREAIAAPAGGRSPGARAHRGPARLAPPVAVASPPEPPAAVETAVEVSDTVAPVGVSPPPSESPPTTESAQSDSVPGAGGEGRGTGEGAGDGDGSGSGDDAGDQVENLGKELHARILGDVSVDLPRDEQQRAVLPHDQATALRQRDIFPRLPESLWPQWRPYVVTLRVCVDEQGQVSDATLLSSAAPRLDRMVAAAARSWRYQPFQAAGRATAFCHGVVIQYEHW